MRLKSNRHIVIFIQRFQAGGAERQASYLANYLMERGFNVSVMAFGTLKEPVASWLEGVPCVALGFTEKTLFNKRLGLWTGIRALVDRWRLNRQLISLKPDVLIPYTYEPNILSGLLWKKTGAKICIWNQRDEGRYFQNTPKELKALQSCTYHVSNSHAGIQFLKSKGIPNPVHIPNAVEIPNDTAKANGTDLKIAMVGNLHVFKDHLTLLKAWKLVVESLYEGAPHLMLYLIGAPGNAEPEIKAFLESNKLESLVTLTGKMDRPEDILKTCMISVFSSVKEGLPNAVLEAMALAMPVIATRIPGTEEALGEDYPYLVPPKDAQAFADAILTLLANPEERVRWGKRNRARTEEAFSIAAHGNDYIRLISG